MGFKQFYYVWTPKLWEARMRGRRFFETDITHLIDQIDTLKGQEEIARAANTSVRNIR